MISKNKYSTTELTRKLQKESLTDFDCGNPALSAFLSSSQALDNSFGKTYVMLSGEKIIGYYNISTGHIEISASPEAIRAGGTVYVNCLAVDKQYQKIKYTETEYISDILLADCIKRVLYLREYYIGFSFISLASTAEGHYLYERNGFFDIEDDMKITKNPGELTCTPMYFPLDYE
ncbi:MAG: N-acetyltransferase [Ruminococcus sp.]|nr:N-acetyltransferase [Ruminococcus sp.]